ncbi:MAG TPA: response regulator [Labilithrix sp.]|nr:response regulator [Labilithrix sp.]
MTNAAIAPKAQVLVVEDDARAREICESTLRSAGYDVVTVRTIEEAWRAIERRRPDLVVLDRTLPDGCGLELLGRCQKTPGMSNVPVVMITTHADGTRVRPSRPAGQLPITPAPREGRAVVLRSVLRPEPVKPVPGHRSSSRDSLTLVYPSGDERTMPALHEHDGSLQARCCHCLRGSPSLAGQSTRAATRAIELGWSPRKHGWACPVCIERYKTARHN